MTIFTCPKCGSQDALYNACCNCGYRVKMSNISVEVKFLPTTDIKEAIREAIYKCREWGVAVIWFEFNGVNIFVNSDSSEQSVYSEYMIKR